MRKNIAMKQHFHANRKQIARWPFLLLIFLSLNAGCHGRNASIVVFGRSGSGISSTVRILLGDSLPPKSSSQVDANITEYEVPIEIPGSGETNFLKIIDVDGVVDDRQPEQDAMTLASLKSYILHPNGLNGNNPSAYVLISRFDDTRFDGEQSLYIQMLRRATVLQKNLNNNQVGNSNIALFTRYMTETKAVQRSPRKKLERFTAIAKQYLGLELDAVVGENKGEDYGLVADEDGMYKLSNRQLYPLNLLKAIIGTVNRNGNAEDAVVIDHFVRQKYKTAGATPALAIVSPFPFSPTNKDVEYFRRIILRSYMADIEDNEVNSALQEAFDSIGDPNKKSRISGVVPNLQSFFQSSNFTRLTDTPKTILEKVRFFQSLPVVVNSDLMSLMSKAFNLTMPPYVSSPIVGYGYDLVKDETLPAVPFSTLEISSWKPSPLGYTLPSFLSCSKLPHSSHQQYKNFANTIEESITQRMSYLSFPPYEVFNYSAFEGQLRLGFNVNPQDDEVASFSAVKEVRTHKMELNDQVKLKEEFVEHINSLRPFDPSVRDSEKEWKGFFGTWGTHIVSVAYVGGFIQGTVLGERLRASFQNSTEVSLTLENIVNFTKVEGEDLTFYGVFGGEKDPKLANVHELSTEERNEVLKNWFESLGYDPVVLTYQMELVPISRIVRSTNETVAIEIDKALNLLVQGNLKYVRIRNNNRRPKPVESTPRLNEEDTSFLWSPNDATTSKSDLQPTTQTPISESQSTLQTTRPSLTRELNQHNYSKIPVTTSHPDNPMASNANAFLTGEESGVGTNNDTILISRMLQKYIAGNQHRHKHLETYVNQTLEHTRRQTEKRQEELERRMAEVEEERKRRAERLQKMEEENAKIEDNNKLARENENRLDEETRTREKQQRLEAYEKIQNENKMWIEQLLATVEQQRKQYEEERKRSPNKNLPQKVWDEVGGWFTKIIG